MARAVLNHGKSSLKSWRMSGRVCARVWVRIGVQRIAHAAPFYRGHRSRHAVPMNRDWQRRRYRRQNNRRPGGAGRIKEAPWCGIDEHQESPVSMALSGGISSEAPL
eukprot:40493-Chlamydomonas_euryale.AAC.4